METLEDEYCPDCGRYGTHTCKGKEDQELLQEAQRLTIHND